MRKSEIRQWLRNFFVKPKDDFDTKVWLWDKAIYGSMMSILALTTKENFPLLVLVGLGGLWIIYEYIAKGK